MSVCTAWKMESNIHLSVLYFLKNWLNHKPFNLTKKCNDFYFSFCFPDLFCSQRYLPKFEGCDPTLFSDKILISQIIIVLQQTESKN